MPRMMPLAVALGLLLPKLLVAQTPPLVDPGDTVRFRMGHGAPWEVRNLVALREGELVVSDDSGTMTVPVSSIVRLEVRRPHPFDGRRALVGAAIGFGAGGVMAMGDEVDAPAWGVAASGGVFALYGAALGGGGDRALRGLLIGAAVGALPGAIIGAASAEPCPRGAWLCFGPEFYAMAGAMAGAAAGGLIGSWMAALTPRVWEHVPPARLALMPGVQGGVSVSLVVTG